MPKIAKIAMMMERYSPKYNFNRNHAGGIVIRKSITQKASVVPTARTYFSPPA